MVLKYTAMFEVTGLANAGIESQAGEDLSNASGEMTVRTIETGGAAGTEASTGVRQSHKF